MKMTNLKQYRLNDICEIKYGKDHKKLSNGNFPVYGTGGIMRYVDSYLHDEASVLIPRKGTLSNLFFVNEKFWTVDTLFWTKINEVMVYPKFLYYKMLTLNLENMNVGSAVPSLTTSLLNQIKINLPSMEIQKEISKILSSLDDKIELNNKINKNLEEMAQALYKQWFVDFEFPNENGEPYKSSGGEMIRSELGLIPKGWEVRTLSNIFKFIKGKKPKIISENNEEDYLEYLTLDVLKGKNNLYASTAKVVLVDKLDVTMVMDGASSGAIYYGKNGILSSTLALLKIIDSEFNSSYIYSVIKNIEPAIKDKQTGSAIPHTDKNFVYAEKIAYSKQILNQFSEFVHNIRLQIINNNNENEKLKNTRDTLLPKLMSGEIEVPIKE